MSLIKEVQARGVNVLINDIRFLVILASVSFGLLVIVILKCFGRRDEPASSKKGDKNKTE